MRVKQTTLSKIFAFIVIIYTFPIAFEKIYNCGKDFGMNIANLFIK